MARRKLSSRVATKRAARLRDRRAAAAARRDHRRGRDPRPARHAAVRGPALDACRRASMRSRSSCTSGQTLSAGTVRAGTRRGSATSRSRPSTAPARSGARATASTSTCAPSASPTSSRPRSGCASPSTATRSSELVDAEGTDVPVYPPRSAADRQHFPDPRRGSHRRLAGPGAADAARGAEGRRGPQVRHAPRRQSARDPARARRERARGSGRAGRQHAHAAARQELLPRQPPHAAAQGRGSRHGRAFSNRASRRRTS